MTDSERVEARLVEAVEAICPEFTPALQERTLSAIAGPAQTLPRPQRRLIAIAVGAVAVLAGLGFIPMPRGRTHGVLAKAMAAMSGGQNIHMTARGWSGNDEYHFEEWSAADGSLRYEKWKNGDLDTVKIESPQRHFDYHATSATAREYDRPPMPNRRQILTAETTRTGLQETMTFVQEHLDGGSVSEWRERSLWGGEVEVMEVEGKVAAGAEISGISYDSPGTVIIRGEVDPQTGRVISLREYLKTEEGRRLVFETDSIEWEAEIPDSTWSFDPPAGTTVTRHTWWTGRADKQLAVEQTGDWTVTVHAIDVNRAGDVVLTISGWLPEGDPGGIDVRPRISQVQAVDDRGCVYSQDSRLGCAINLTGGYEVTTLHPDPKWSGASPPSTITLTIGSPADAATGHPPVTFRNLRLPSRPAVDDVFKAATEVIQY